MPVVIKRIRIVIVDDHAIVREGVRRLLNEWKDLSIVGEARDGAEGIRKVRGQKPDVVLLDLAMPRMTGLEALSGIRRAEPAARIIILTVHKAREYVRQALAARVDGYLLKDTAPAEYVRAIRSVARGKFFISPAVAHHASVRSARRLAGRLGLNEREFQYFSFAARGMRSTEIAWFMDCTVAAVSAYRRTVLRKLQLRNLAMLTRYALEHGL